MGFKWSKEEWYCQNIPENFVCYANDSIELLKYLTIPVLIVSIFLFYNKFRSTILHRVFSWCCFLWFLVTNWMVPSS